MPISCMPLRGLWDGPIFGRSQGTLTALQNMEMRAGGYAEARGGMQELMPNGGTAADAISAGGYASVHQMATSYGWVRTFDSAAGAGSQYSKNLQLDPGGWRFFPTSVVGDICYFGADLPFSRIRVRGSLAGAGTATVVYEYWNGSAWTALTTSETITFPSPGASAGYASWTMPTNWVANTVGDAGTGNVLKYWMRARLTAVVGFTSPTISHAVGYWSGMREIYELSHSPRTSAVAGTLKRHGQTGTTEEWFTISSALYSGHASPARSASYQGRLYYVNQKEQKRWDGANHSDIGLPAFDVAVTTVTPAVGAGAGLGAGIWRYYAAWGYGQTKNLGAAAHQWYQPSSYGEGKAAYIGAEVTTTPGNEQVTLTITGTMPADACAVYIYRTQDLTGVDTGKRADFPAFLVDTLERNRPGTNPATALELNGVLPDVYPAPVFGNIEAIKYDNLPPSNSKFVGVYQNRLMLGDDSAWYWSDPFKPDSFNRAVRFIPLARAFGGRHMGGIEFGDQFVMFTEDQTWALTNLDQEVPYLFPVHPGVGCIAPDSIAVSNGVLIWAARDGFYAWDGNGVPKLISESMDQTFGVMSYETHGGSKAAFHNGRYDVRISSPDYATIGGAYRFSLEAFQAQKHPWSTIVLSGFASTLFPLATVHAPLGNNDAGAIHSLWGKVDYGTGAGEYGLFLGELTTQDAGSNYSCAGTMHFPLPPNELFAPSRVLAYYQAADGWGTPALAFTPSSNIGSGVGTIGTGTPDTGADYSLVAGTFSEVSSGSSDLQVSFTVSSAASGTVNRQRFFGAVLEGKPAGVRRGLV